MAKQGRPSKFKASFSDALIKHQAEGLSFESFAGVAGVNRDTIYEWLKLHPEFKEAKSIAEMQCYLWWDRVNVRGVFDKDINTGIVAINMRNRFGWMDKKQSADAEEETPLPKKTADDVSRVLRIARERK